MKDDMLECPNIPYDRPPKISEIVQLLHYFIDQKKLFEDDIIIAIFNKLESKTEDIITKYSNIQSVVVRRRDRPFVVPEFPNDKDKTESVASWMRSLCKKCYASEIIKQLEALTQDDILEGAFANPQMTNFTTLNMKNGIDSNEDYITIYNSTCFPDAKSMSDIIGDGRVFNTVTGEELLDVAKKAELIASMRGA